MFRKIVLIVLVSINSCFAYAGNGFENNYQERAFLKTDKGLYISGEIIWYSATLFDNSNGAVAEKNTFLYVEVLDSLNNSIIKQVSAIKNGYGSGSLQIPAEALSGNYFIRAYTAFMKNYGPEAFFHKQLTIVNTFKQIEAAFSQSLNLQVKAEGGVLATGIENNISVLLTDNSSQRISFTGLLIDSRGDTVQSFLSAYPGYKNLKLVPDTGIIYTVVVTTPSGKEIRKTLPLSKENAIVLLAEEENGRFVVSVEKNGSITGPISLQVLHNNKEKNIPVTFNNNKSEILLSKNDLPEGIHELRILNGNDVLASRLLFKSIEAEGLLQLKTNKSIFDKRENVELELTGNNSSVAGSKILVYAINKSIPDVRTDGLQLYRLLLSVIENIPENELLEAFQNGYLHQLLVHARKKEAIESSSKVYNAETDKQEITGIVRDKSGQVVPGAELFLSRRGHKIDFFGAVADNEGKIVFYIEPDERNKELILQSEVGYNVEILSPFSNSYAAMKLPAFQLKPEWEPYLQEASINLQVEMSFNAERWNDFEKPAPDSSNFYHTPDYTYYLDNYRRFASIDETIMEFILPAKVRRKDGKKGILLYDKNKEEILMEPLLLLDGIPVFDHEKLLDYSPYLLKRIDLINTRYFFGPYMFNGIISFKSFSGKMEGFELPATAQRFVYEQPSAARIYNNIHYREGQNLETIPDNRGLLLWYDVAENNLSAPIRFSTSDISGNYKIVAEVTLPDGSTSITSKDIEVQ